VLSLNAPKPAPGYPVPSRETFNALGCAPASGSPYPVAGRSPPPSRLRLTRICLRCAIHGSAGQIRRRAGHGEPEASSSHSGTGRRGVTPAVETAYVGHSTGNMASCHFPLADLRRLVITRASGPDAEGVGGGLCPATVSRRRRRDGVDGATASPQRASGETVRGNPEPDRASQTYVTARRAGGVAFRRQGSCGRGRRRRRRAC